ncbi:MAG TPA: cupin domain-containing protein [Vineibacter terrae]|nr:cupin domain-containing protein [Vineibacter terrae]
MQARGMSMWRRASLMSVAVGCLTLFAGTTIAGECPADRRGQDVMRPGSAPAKGVTDKVLAAIDVAKEPAKIDGRLLRLRRLEIAPGGIVPYHSHGDRPAIIYVVQGEIYEHASTCSVPILHKAGEVARETHATSHWWQNKSNQTVVLLSADLLRDASDKNM